MKLFSFILVTLILSCKNHDKYPEVTFPDGGYELPKHLDKDSIFYFYPIKSIESANDSFHDAFYGNLFLGAFGEPNISTKSFGEPIFRLIYECSTCIAYIITLTPTEIVVKKGDRVDYAKRDDSLLTDLENFHLGTLERNFPIIKGNPKVTFYRQHYLDSLIDLYPKLLDPNYLNFLLAKVFVPCKTPFTYTTTKISISSEEYQHLINMLNESGYWKMPIHIDCNNAPMDGAGFTLEANTGSKYNITKFGSCEDGPTNFIRACQELVKLAKIDNKFMWK